MESITSHVFSTEEHSLLNNKISFRRVAETTDLQVVRDTKLHIPRLSTVVTRRKC